MSKSNRNKEEKKHDLDHIPRTEAGGRSLAIAIAGNHARDKYVARALKKSEKEERFKYSES